MITNGTVFYILDLGSHSQSKFLNSDYNFVRSANGECVPVGPEPIPAGICSGNREGEKYMGSSGYRLVPGNTCTKAGGVVLDTPVQKDCSKGRRGLLMSVSCSKYTVPYNSATTGRRSYPSNSELSLGATRD
jgi:hypothetical protein